MTSQKPPSLSESYKLPPVLPSVASYKPYLEAVCNNATVALFIMDERQYCVYMNTAAERLTGYTLPEVQGRALHDVIHHTRPDGRPYPLCECPIDQAFPQNNQEQGEEVFVHKDGHFYPVAYTASPIREASGIVGTIIEVRDITQEKLDEAAKREGAEALRQSEERFRQFSENVKDLFWITDLRASQVLYVNPAFETIYQRSRGSLRQLADWLSFIHPDDCDRVQAATLRAMADGFEIEYRIVRPDGSIRWIRDRGFVLPEPDGEPHRMAGIAEDITERKRTEAELSLLLQREQTARQAAETANRIKDEFLAVLSHELRTPMNPIVGWAGLLKQGRLDAAKTQEAIAAIERNAKLQVQLIDDLLDVSRILRGKLSLSTQSVDLRAVIAAALETVRLAAESKSLAIETQFPAQINVSGDAGRLQQVIWNLLSNAVKFTPAGGRIGVKLEQVEEKEGDGGMGGWGDGPGHKASEPGSRSFGEVSTLSSTRRAHEPGAGRNASSQHAHSPTHSLAQITITDTGKGINPQFLPHLFEHFRQEDGATTRQFGGLGLGLAIARQIVELHGGTIDATSPGEGQGATFRVRLPLLRSGGAGEQRSRGAGDHAGNLAQPAALAGVRVLVVDDEADSLEFIAFVLEQEGAIVRTVTSAQQAIAELAAFAPDILLSDIGMPEMDGYMLIEQIRRGQDQAMPAGASRLKAIALTAYAGEVDRSRAAAAGFQQHLAKPVDPVLLVDTILDLCRS